MHCADPEYIAMLAAVASSGNNVSAVEAVQRARELYAEAVRTQPEEQPQEQSQ